MLAMTLREQLLKIVDAYCAATERSEARVSTQVFSGGRRLQQIRNGGDIGTMGYERSMQWFSDNWPDGVDWPMDVQRPSGGANITEAAE